jgi:hypothetical protein
MHENQSPADLLSLTVVLFFIGTQFGWLPWVENKACPQDIFLSISSDCEINVPELFLEMGPSPGKFKPFPHRPTLSSGKFVQRRMHPCSPYACLKIRSPPKVLSN